MAYLTQPDYVKYICSCGQLKPITSLYFCRHCLKIRCGFCICHEKNRCSSCFDCPSCFHTLSTRATLAQPRQAAGDAADAKVENKQPKKMYYLSCFNCRWTSRDVGIPDQPVASGGWPERSNPYSARMNQLLELYKAIAQQEKQEKLEKERKKFAIRGKYITLTDKTGLTGAMARNIAGLPASDAGSSSAIASFVPSQPSEDVDELPEDAFTKEDVSSYQSLERKATYDVSTVVTSPASGVALSIPQRDDAAEYDDDAQHDTNDTPTRTRCLRPPTQLPIKHTTRSTPRWCYHSALYRLESCSLLAIMSHSLAIMSHSLAIMSHSLAIMPHSLAIMYHSL
ncbi:Dynactin subunit 4, partial [Operophtera brumata]